MTGKNLSGKTASRRGYITLRQRLLVFFVLLTLLSTSLFFAFYLFRARESLLRNLSKECTLQLSHVMESAADAADQTAEFANRICMDENVLALLERSAGEASVFDSVNEAAVNNLRQHVINFSLSSYMLSVIVRGSNGADIRSGLEGYLLSDEEIDRFLAAETDSQHWCGLLPNPNRLTDNPEVIPFHRPVYHPLTHKVLGDILIVFSPALFRHVFEENMTTEFEELSLYNADDACMYMLNQKIQNAESAQNAQNVQDVERTQIAQTVQNADSVQTLETVQDVERSQTEGRKSDTKVSPRSLHLQQKSVTKEWTVHLFLSSRVLHREFRTILQSSVILMILIALSFILLSVILSRDLTEPIYRMEASVRKIASGDFSDTVPVTRPGSEVDELELQIHQMGKSIEELMKQQEEKQQLELQMLQAQLNPHFLNNTLNTIRMMAALQGKSGIAEMIEALGVLVRANLRSSREIITLGEEKELFDSYIYIQNVRMKGLLNVRTQIPEDLMQMQVLKFILQPAAENSILHGIGTNPLGGTIIVSAWKAEDALWLCVEDDGRGMTEEELENLRDRLEHPQQAVFGTQTHGTALPNIQMRIQLRWRKEYGIRITSAEGKGTRVLFRLPVLLNTAAADEPDTAAADEPDAAAADEPDAAAPDEPDTAVTDEPDAVFADASEGAAE